MYILFVQKSTNVLYKTVFYGTCLYSKYVRVQSDENTIKIFKNAKFRDADDSHSTHN